MLDDQIQCTNVLLQKEMQKYCGARKLCERHCPSHVIETLFPTNICEILLRFEKYVILTEKKKKTNRGSEIGWKY